MSWAQRDAEHMEDRADEIARLEIALAEMTGERDSLMEANEFLKDQAGCFRDERDDLLRVCMAIRETAHDYEDRLNAVKAKLDAVEDIVRKWDENYRQLKCGREFYQYAEDIQRAHAATGPSVRQRVEAVIAQWRGQHWIYTRGEVIRRTCIQEIEDALKEE